MIGTRRIVRTSWLAALALLLAALAPIETITADPPPTTAETASETRAPAKRTTARRSATRRRTTARRPTARRTTTRRPAARRRVVRRRFVPRLTAAQRRQIRRWHTRATRTEIEVWSRHDPLPIVFRPLTRDRFELVPDDAYGAFSGEALDRAELALAYREDGSHHAVHPRLLTLVHRAVRHFRAPYVWVISGYRGGNPRSRHAQGRAIDLVLPGVTDRRLAAYLRPQGFVGVGIYPTSGFVHLDVRARSYFWSDSSGPDQSNRERRILPTMGPRFDRIARNLGAEPVPDLDDTADEELEGELEQGGVTVGPDTTGDVEIEPSEGGSRPDVSATDAGVSLDAGLDAGVDAGVQPDA